MLRPSVALGSLAAVLALAGACGGSSSAGPSPGGQPEAGAHTQPDTAGLPCDVDKVLANNCRSCHSAPPQFGSPMPLGSWDDLHARAPSDATKKVHELVVARIADDARPMPPAPNRRLSEPERKTLSDWIAAGAPRGSDDCNNTTTPITPEGLSCAPDLSLAPESEWEMPDSAGDEYVCWGVDLARDPPTQITAFAPKIDNTKIVHHVVLYEAPSSYSRTPKSCNAGAAISWRMVLGWAPGTKNFELPADVGFPVSSDPANPTHYVVQMHYSNPQKLVGERDKSSIDLCTSPPRKYEADVMAFGSQDFTIPAAPPAGGKYTIDCALTVPPSLGGIHFFAAMPHMHKLGVAMSTTLTPKDGGPEVDLGTMEAFSFDSQGWLPIDATTKGGDTIRTKCSWVNGTGAPVGFGENTADEMCYSFTMYYPRIVSSLWSWAAPASGPPIGATCN